MKSRRNPFALKLEKQIADLNEGKKVIHAGEKITNSSKNRHSRESGNLVNEKSVGISVFLCN